MYVCMYVCVCVCIYIYRACTLSHTLCDTHSTPHGLQNSRVMGSRFYHTAEPTLAGTWALNPER